MPEHHHDDPRYVLALDTQHGGEHTDERMEEALDESLLLTYC